MDKKRNTLLLYEKPDMYFFPYLGNVYSPLTVSFHSVGYWIYRVMHLLRIPGYALFWRHWGRLVKDADRVIIFDYGYQRGMEKYIKRINPSCQVFLFYWNIVNKYREGYKDFLFKDNIYSTDINDCKKYHFKYNTMFFSSKLISRWNEEKKNTAFFMGSDKGRYNDILNIKSILETKNIPCDFHIITDRKDDNGNSIAETKFVDYETYLSMLDNSGIVLDINQKGQSAFTMRVAESIFRSKKLITFNAEVKNCRFYEKGNVFIVNSIEEFEGEAMADFLLKNFVEYTDDDLSEFTYEAWENRFE